MPVKKKTAKRKTVTEKEPEKTGIANKIILFNGAILPERVNQSPK